ncbi:MAG: dihydropteroate synthase [candidate division KSB1 bacterium]|jgi:dihydropteroate synthase|nr:dihydropteroate synthase [candidate division KSB1 bacterium]
MKPEQVRLNCRGKSLDLSTHTHVMGILNVTPDSFSDGGKYFDAQSAVNRGIEIESEGADIIDVGAESTRPGADPVSEEEEIQRLSPVVEALVGRVNIPISIDTYKVKVADEMLRRGAHIINDISGLRFEPEMKNIVAEHQAAIVIMHIKGVPRNMQENPQYDDVISEISNYLSESASMAQAAGIAKESIVIDPGIGFGKRVADNYAIMRNLRKFHSIGYPLLIGTSRKSFIRKALNVDAENSYEGTAATVVSAIHHGVHIVRVHDVKQTVRVCHISDLITGKRVGI